MRVGILCAGDTCEGEFLVQKFPVVAEQVIPNPKWQKTTGSFSVFVGQNFGTTSLGQNF